MLANLESTEIILDEEAKDQSVDHFDCIGLPENRRHGDIVAGACIFKRNWK